MRVLLLFSLLALLFIVRLPNSTVLADGSFCPASYTDNETVTSGACVAPGSINVQHAIEIYTPYNETKNLTVNAGGVCYTNLNCAGTHTQGPNCLPRVDHDFNEAADPSTAGVYYSQIVIKQFNGIAKPASPLMCGSTPVGQSVCATNASPDRTIYVPGPDSSDAWTCRYVNNECGNTCSEFAFADPNNNCTCGCSNSCDEGYPDPNNYCQCPDPGDGDGGGGGGGGGGCCDYDCDPACYCDSFPDDPICDDGGGCYDPFDYNCGDPLDD